jgi:hypothetical protein
MVDHDPLSFLSFPYGGRWRFTRRAAVNEEKELPITQKVLPGGVWRTGHAPAFEVASNRISQWGSATWRAPQNVHEPLMDVAEMQVMWRSAAVDRSQRG